MFRNYRHRMRIFLSYRRDDAGGYAGRLRADLENRRFEVFQDVRAIGAGERYAPAIDQALKNSAAVLAIIGRDWHGAPASQGSRLREASDYVRLELATALEGKTRVIPVRVGGAPLPAPGDLPDELQDLIQHQDLQLRDDSWDQDVDRLERQLRGKKDYSGWPSRRVRVFSLAAGVAVAGLLAGFYFLMPGSAPVACSAAHHAWPAKGLGPVYSHPAVAGGTVYVGSGSGNVYALNASTGAICWRHSTEAGVYSSPWLFGGVLYVGDANGNVYALNVHTGRQVWAKRIGALKQSFVLDSATKDIYIGGVNGTIYALNITTHKAAWRPFRTGFFIDASSVYFKNTVYVCNYSGTLYALNATTGTRLWHFHALPRGKTGYCAPTVEPNTGTVYVVTGSGISNGRVYALHP